MSENYKEYEKQINEGERYWKKKTTHDDKKHGKGYSQYQYLKQIASSSAKMVPSAKKELSNLHKKFSVSKSKALKKYK